MLPDPIIQIGNYKVYMYGLMIAVGILVGSLVLYVYGKKKKLDEAFLDFCFFDSIGAIFFGFGSAALFQALYNYIEDPSAGFSLGGGITFIGGLLGGVIFFIAVYFIFRKKLTERLIRLVPLAPCIILIDHAFGRVGCFFAGCCYGKQTDSIFGIKFPGMSHAVHPTQLYEAIFLFIMFALCSYLYLKKDFRHNMSLYLVSYGVFRFCIEFLRGDDRGEFIFGISPSQFWSIVMVAAGVGTYFLIEYLSRRAETEDTAPLGELSETPPISDNESCDSEGISEVSVLPDAEASPRADGKTTIQKGDTE